MSVENWKLEKDLCRCCLSEGTFQNLAEPVTNQGAEEIYSDMLIEGLDVNLTPVSGPLCTSTYTICEECILRLRDACSFKRQVLLSEKRFRELYSKDIIQCHSSVKKEAPDSDNEEGPVKQEMIEDDDDFRQYDDDDDGNLKCEVEEEIQEVKKAKTKKPKAKEKTKPKKRLGRPRKAPGGPEAEPEAEPDGDPAGTNDNKALETILDIENNYTINVDGDKKYECNICGIGYDLLQYINLHMKCHVAVEVEALQRRRNNHICDFCRSEFECRQTFIAHMQKHKCPKCPLYVRRSEIVKHVQLFHSWRARRSQITSTMCADVKEVYEDSNIFKYTEHADNLTIKYKCPKCSFVGRKTDLLIHMRRAHPLLYSCIVCGKKYRNKWMLVQHQTFHHRVTLSSSKLFSNDHNNSTPNCPVAAPKPGYICEVCGYRCTEKRRLVQHQNTVHLKEKNISCQICGMKFFNKIGIRRHMIVHNPVKKYECEHCKKKFARGSTLRLHEKIHTGDKKKVCLICEAKFVQKASLNYHMLKYHPDLV